ncbi:MAG TPA: hypothetical protein VFR50_03655 [Casimicrobiaceae bacterium]|jgi:hypothetical protein|nr:hypothetical protein [Casimicrobiaceae bacterium]
MNVDSIFNGLASYVNFIVDFLALRAMQPYARLGTVNGELMSYFFAGLLLSIVIQYTSKLPTFSPQDDSAPTSRNDADVGDGGKSFLEKSQLAIFIPFLLVGTAFMHLSLLVGVAVAGLDIGSFKDTINATLASSTIGYPIQATAARAQNYAKTIQKLGGTPALIAGVIHLGAAAANFAGVIYGFHATAVVHGLTMRQMLWPAIAFVVLVGLFVVPLGYLIMLRRAADQIPTQQRA